MDEMAIIKYITNTFENTHIVTSNGNTFFLYDPAEKFPYVTIVTNDDYDQFSELNRPDVFRLNIGVNKSTYRRLFGNQNDALIGDHDFTALDKLLPHPLYARMYWVCILNPAADTFETVVQPLLAEAYALTVSKYSKLVKDGQE